MIDGNLKASIVALATKATRQGIANLSPEARDALAALPESERWDLTRQATRTAISAYLSIVFSVDKLDKAVAEKAARDAVTRVVLAKLGMLSAEEQQTLAGLQAKVEETILGEEKPS
jgi:uncharacterized protein YcbX